MLVGIVPVVFAFFALALGESVPSGNKTAVNPEVEVSSRMDLHLGVSSARGQGQSGGQSGSVGYSYGYNAGRIYSDGSRDTYGSDANTGGTSYRSGDDAPNTDASSNSYVQPGSAYGNEYANVDGQGTAQTYSKSVDRTYSLPDGSVLYMNFKKVNSTAGHAGNSTAAQLRNSTDAQSSNSTAAPSSSKSTSAQTKATYKLA